MRNLTTNMMIAAAALVVAAGAAQAQQLKAEIPFSFRAAGTLMPAGEYRVEGIRSQNTVIFKLINVDTNRAVLAVSNAGNNPAQTADATLSFECSGAHCVLVQVAPGTGTAYGFARPKPGKDEDTRVALIRAVLIKNR